MSNALDEFLKDVKTNDVPLETKVLEDSQEKEIPKEDPSEDDDKPKNRRMRRLESKLQAEREANIALNERIKALSEFQNFAKENEADPQEVTVFGTDEQGKIVKNYFDKRIEQAQKQAKEEAVKEFEERMKQEKEAEQAESEYLDEVFENLEEKYNVDLTSKKAKDFRNGYIDFLIKMSPKDKNDEIVEYADPDSTFETYQQITQREKPRAVSDRQKELASRSMTNSGTRMEEAPKGPMTFQKARKFIDSLRG